VKRSQLIHELTVAGCYLLRHGRRHDLFVNTENGKKAPVPRHAEIKESLAD